MKITLSRKELSAALLFASTDETRFTLMGIQVETRGNQPTLTATDGRRLVVIESSSDQDSEYTPGDAGFILRADFVKPLCALSKSIGGELLPWLMFDMSPGSKRVQVKIVGRECYLDTHDGALTEGSYPNWRQIIPAKDVERAPIREIAINSEYVGDFAKAAKLLGSESAIASFNLAGKDAQGSYGAIEVRLESLPQFYGLVMPCKFSEGEDYQPEFLAIRDAFAAPKDDPESEDSGLEPGSTMRAVDTVTISAPGSGIAPVTMPLSEFSHDSDGDPNPPKVVAAMEVISGAIRKGKK